MYSYYLSELLALSVVRQRSSSLLALNASFRWWMSSRKRHFPSYTFKACSSLSIRLIGSRSPLSRFYNSLFGWSWSKSAPIKESAAESVFLAVGSRAARRALGGGGGGRRRGRARARTSYHTLDRFYYKYVYRCGDTRSAATPAHSHSLTSTPRKTSSYLYGI